jgi:hypothetical protein
MTTEIVQNLCLHLQLIDVIQSLNVDRDNNSETP